MNVEPPDHVQVLSHRADAGFNLRKTENDWEVFI
jgi:hypothetical protein